MQVIEPTPSQAAVVLKNFLAKEAGSSIKLSLAQEAIARTRGFASFQAYVAHVPHRGATAMVMPASSDDNRIYTIKLLGTQRDVVAQVVSEAAEEAKNRSRDTTPQNQAFQEQRHTLLSQALAELTGQARCYLEEGAAPGAAPSSGEQVIPVYNGAQHLFIVSGRLSGDDDDTVDIIWASDEEDARLQFRLQVCSDHDLSEKRAVLDEDDNRPVYVNTAYRLASVVNGRLVLAEAELPKPSTAPTREQRQAEAEALSESELKDILRDEYDKHEDWNDKEYSGGMPFMQMVKLVAKHEGFTLHYAAKRYLKLIDEKKAAKK